jgi:hypothetical protein
MNATGYLFGATHPLALKRLRVRGSHLNYPFHLEQGSSCKTLVRQSVTLNSAAET